MIIIFNISIFLVFFYFLTFSKFKYVNFRSEILLLIAIHFISIFLINDTLNSLLKNKYQNYFPDQVKYTSAVELFRLNNLKYDIDPDTKKKIDQDNWFSGNTELKGAVKKSSYFFSFFPFIITKYDLTSIALINFTLFIILIMYLFNNYSLPNYLKYLILFIPSIWIAHSLALKDMALLFFTFFFLLNLIKKNYFYSLFFLLFLFLFREKFFYISLIFYFMYVFYFSLKKINMTFSFYLFFFFSFIIILLFFEQQIINYINNIRRGYYSENLNENFKLFNNFYEIFLFFLKNFFNIILLLKPVNVQQYISSLENIFVYTIAIYFIYKKSLLKKDYFIFLLIFYFFNLFFISVLIDNAGAIYRYKFPVEISLFLLILTFSYKSKNRNA